MTSTKVDPHLMENIDEETGNQLIESSLKRIDFVLVNDKNETKHVEPRQIFKANLKQFGLELEEQESGGKCFVLIYVPFKIMLKIAEKTHLKLPIEVNNFEQDSTVRNIWNKLTSFFSSQEAIELDDLKRTHFNAPYSSSRHEQFKKFFNEKNADLTFTEPDRIFLTYQILLRTSYSAPQESLFDSSRSLKSFGIERLIQMKAFTECFPLHQELKRKEPTDRQHLWNHWANPKRLANFQPLNLIRHYFGEKLAFYFAWLGFYTSSLILPSLIGVLVFAYGLITVFSDIPTNEICNETSNILMCPLCSDESCKPWNLSESCFNSRLSYVMDNSATVFFSIFMSVWSVVLIDFWQRKQSKLQFKWDTPSEEEMRESIRPQFENNSVKQENKFTGEMEYLPKIKQIIFSYLASFSIIILMIALVIALVFGMIVYKISVKVAMIKTDASVSISSNVTTVTAAIINLIGIYILSYIYSIVAIKLTDLENHRTDSQYENALTLKMYLFQFVNFYASLFYIAFFKGRKFDSKKENTDDFNQKCDQSGCMGELCIQLIFIMVAKQIISNIQEGFLPWLKNMYRKRTLKQKNKPTLTRWEKDLTLIPWSNLTLFDEYLEMVIQFGFITLFVMAFPLGPLFAFLNNLIEIKIDSVKFLTKVKRPSATKAYDIGIWLTIINTISKLGVILNGFLIAFTSDFIPRMVYLIGEKKPNLSGYVDYTLYTRNVSGTLCRERDFRNSYGQKNEYEYSEDFWEVLVARLVFVVCFEHIVFALVGLMHILIPNTPWLIKKQIEHEKTIIQRVEWEAQSATNLFKQKSIEKQDL